MPAPVLCQGFVAAGAAALGAAAALSPPGIGLAVSGALHDALAEQSNEQLRRLSESGMSQEVRAAGGGLCRPSMEEQYIVPPYVCGSAT